jgi:hypothetical protein
MWLFYLYLYPEDGLLSQAETCRGTNQQINNTVQQVSTDSFCEYNLCLDFEQRLQIQSGATSMCFNIYDNKRLHVSAYVQAITKLCSQLTR